MRYISYQFIFSTPPGLLSVQYSIIPLPGEYNALYCTTNYLMKTPCNSDSGIARTCYRLLVDVPFISSTLGSHEARSCLKCNQPHIDPHSCSDPHASQSCIEDWPITAEPLLLHWMLWSQAHPMVINAYLSKLHLQQFRSPKPSKR